MLLTVNCPDSLIAVPLLSCRNPSIGLDSIYQKHVYSRLAPLEAPEAAGDSNDSKVCRLPATTYLQLRLLSLLFQHVSLCLHGHVQSGK